MKVITDNLTFLLLVFKKVYDTNIYETLINNDFNFDSYDFISSKGIVTDYSFLVKKF